MLLRKQLPILMVGALALGACDRQAVDTTKTTTQTETKQVGTTSQSTSETRVATAEGESKSVTNTYVGTLTVLTPGKSIEVMTGNKELHSFALDGKDDTLVIDPAAAVGSKVTLIEEKGYQGVRRITVTIAAAE